MKVSGAAPMGVGRRRKSVFHRPDSGFLEFPNNKEHGMPVGQEDNGRKRIGGKHFNWGEHVRLEGLVNALFLKSREPDFTCLGALLDRRRSSVSREYAGESVVNLTGGLVPFRAYLARKAQDDADRAALDKGPARG